MTDEGGFVVPQHYKDDLARWFKLTMDKSGQDTLRRLLATRTKFHMYGTHNEECAEYVISVLDYILGDTDDDPTADWALPAPPAPLTPKIQRLA